MILPRCARAKGRTHPFLIDETLITFNRQGDGLTWRDLLASCLVLADSGSGKSSGILATLAGAALRTNASLVVTCVKPGDARDAVALATKFGRPARVVSFANDRFNPLAHEQFLASEDSTGKVERLTDQILLPLRRQRREGSGGDPFWAADGARFVRHLVTIFVAAGIPITYKLIYDTLINLPTGEENLDDEAWQRSCPAYGALLRASKRTDLLDWQRDDLDAAAEFLFRTVPNMPERTKQSTVSTLAAALDSCVRGITGHFLNTDSCTWDPAEVVDSPGVVIFDMPVQTAGPAAMTIQRMLLSAVQRAVLRRSNPTHPVMLLCDEYQEIMDPDDDPAFTGAPRFFFRLILFPIMLFMYATSAWVTPLMRTRIGLVTLVIDAPLGLITLGITASFFSEPWPESVLGVWLLILGTTLAGHLYIAVRTFFRPGTEHVHRQDMGAPNQALMPLWDLTLRGWGNTPLRIALVGEPLLLVLVAFILWQIEPFVADEPSGVWILFLLSALGVFLQAASMIVKGLWKQQLLKDQETEQEHTAEAFTKQPSRVTGREAEGVARITPVNQRSW